MNILHWMKKENSGLARTTLELAIYELTLMLIAFTVRLVQQRFMSVVRRLCGCTVSPCHLLETEFL